MEPSYSSAMLLVQTTLAQPHGAATPGLFYFSERLRRCLHCQHAVSWRLLTRRTVFSYKPRPSSRG